MSCTQCGSAFEGDEAFCTICGSQRPAEAAPAASDARWAPADEISETTGFTAAARTVAGPPPKPSGFVVPPQPPRTPVAEPSHQGFQPPAPTPPAPAPAPAMYVPAEPPPQAPWGQPAQPSVAQPPPQAYGPDPTLHPVPVAHAQPPVPVSTGIAPVVAPPSGLEPATAEVRSNAKPVLIGVAAALAVAVLIIGAIAVLGGNDEKERAAPTGPPPVKPATLISDATDEATDALGAFEGAQLLTQVNQASAGAEQAATAIDDLIVEVDRVASPAARTATREALTDLGEVLHSFAGLATWDGANADQWTMLKVAADQKQGSLEDSLDRLVELKAIKADDALLDQIDASTVATDRTVAAINTKLKDWQAAVAQIEADKQARLTALDDYAAAVRPLMNRYSGLRKEMQDFVNKVDTVDATYEEAYAFLESAASQRQAVRSDLASVTPPASIAAAHSGIVAIIDTSVSAINDATAGVREHEYSYYGYYKDTAGWQTYLTKSNQITSSYNTAVNVWDDAVSKERAAIEATPLPPRPNV